MESFYGADPDDLDSRAATLRNQSEVFGQIYTNLVLAAEQATWSGPDREQYLTFLREQASGPFKDLAALCQAYAAVLAARAAKQREVSAAGAGASGGAVPANQAGSSGGAGGKRSWWKYGYDVLKTVPVVGAAIEVGEFVVDVGNAGGVLTYEVVTLLKYGWNSDEYRWAARESEVAMYRFNTGALDVVWGVGGTFLPWKGARDIHTMVSNINAGQTVSDKPFGYQTSHYSDPTYWLDDLYRPDRTW